MIKLKQILKELSYNFLYRRTPREYVDRSRDVTAKLVTKTPAGKYIYRTVTRSNGNVHNQWIKPLKPGDLTNMNKDVILWCDCGNFTYENEYVLWKKNSSHIVNSNGNPPVIRNPRRITKLCKHLTAVMDDFERRI